MVVPCSKDKDAPTYEEIIGDFAVANNFSSPLQLGSGVKITDSKGKLVGGAIISVQKEGVNLVSVILCTNGFSTSNISLKKGIDLSALMKDGKESVFDLEGSYLNDDERLVLPMSSIKASASSDEKCKTFYNIKMDIKLLVADISEWGGEEENKEPPLLDETLEGTIYLKLENVKLSYK